MKNAMRAWAVLLLTILLGAPLRAAGDETSALEQFQAVLQAIEHRSFDGFRKTVDQTDFTHRVFSHQPLEEEVRQSFKSNFWEVVEAGFLQAIPASDSRVKTELIQFTFQDGRGQAVVRFSLPGYAYVFQMFDLRHDKRSRMKVVDWSDSTIGRTFSARIGEELITIMPTKAATRKLLTLQNLADSQLFQVTELLKAVRDKQAERFFEIYDQLDERLKGEPLVARHAASMVVNAKYADRLVSVLGIFADVYSGDPNRALMTSEYYLLLENYAKSFDALRRYDQYVALKEGALPAKLSALALAAGKAEDAETFAVEATVNEPGFELGWWSLLRTRAAAGDYSGSLDALTYLEDNFDYRLDEAKLRRDRFKAFTKLARSQAFIDWRTSRD